MIATPAADRGEALVIDTSVGIAALTAGEATRERFVGLAITSGATVVS